MATLKKSVAAIAFVAAIVSEVFAECPGSDWTATRTLNAANSFELSYKVENQDIVLRARAQTSGFIGIGISEAGHMMGADILTMAVVGGKPVIQDRFADWTGYSNPLGISTPSIDTEQSWTVVCSSESAGFTDFIIKRALDTGDCKDRAVVDGEQFLIFAWGSSDTVSYHGANRGSVPINFYSAVVPGTFVVPSDATASQELLLSNYPMRNTTTQYVLQKIDLGADVKHIVAVEPIIKPGDQQFVHHVLLHDCGSGTTDSPGIGSIIQYLELDTAYNSGDFTGGYPISPLGSDPCLNMVYGWAKGGGPVSYPSVAGVRTGQGNARIVVVELHIDNPTHVNTNQLITSGVRIHTTTTMREHDVGTLVLGNPRANFPTLPAGQDRVHREGTCASQCTQTFTGPLQLFMSFPHMHTYGKEIWSEKKTSGGAKSVISAKQYWNFGFQNQIPINVVVNPSDSISMHCVYDTSLSSAAINFGTPSNEEMCMDFILFYPKAHFPGLNCGWDYDNTTLCGTSSLVGVSNPIADGLSIIPDSVAVGERECSQTQTQTPVGAPGSAPGSAVGIRTSRLVAMVMLIVVSMWA